MEYAEIIDRLEALMQEYHESFPKRIVTKLSGSFEVYDSDEDRAFIDGMNRAIDLVRELTVGL